MKIKTAAAVVIALALMLAIIPAVLAGGPLQWGDNFDGYAPGTDLHGLNGWKGWGNNPIFTAFTTDVQARTAPNSVDIVSNADLVQEYTEDSGFWIYRASQYIPGNFSGRSFFIMLNQYDDSGATNNWSVQVNFDSITGVMTDDGLAGASQPFVVDQWVDICLEIDLDNDTQVFYYNGDVFYSSTWSQHVTGGGISSLGAANLFANGAGSVYYDDMYLYAGAPGECGAPSPVAAIDFEKTVGTDPLVCAATDTIDVTAGTDVTYCYSLTNTGEVTLSLHDVTDSELGVLLDDFPAVVDPGDSTWFTATTTINVTTTNTADWTAWTSAVFAGDSDTATVNVIEVPPQPAIVMTKTVGTDPAVCANTDSIMVDPGTDVYYCYTVMNTGNVNLQLHDLYDDQLGSIFTGLVYRLFPGESVDTVAAGLTISDTILADVTNTGVWTAYNVAGGSATYTDTATVMVSPPTDVSLSSLGSVSTNLTLPALTTVLVAALLGGGLLWRRRKSA